LKPPFAALDEPTGWLFALNRFGIRPGLKRIKALLTELGHPERDLRTLVVAGTNGKGSTTHLLAALLRGCGYRVLTFTSPHLLQVYERIQIDGIPVAAERFAEKVVQIRPHVETHAASWFETLTALAVDLAREEEVDFLCCETGLGGRLDATNALPAVATLLTTVSLDHQRILGETREEIAAEKLGLLKTDVPFFCAVDSDLRSQVFAAAVAAGAPCYFLDELARWRGGPDGWQLILRGHAYAELPSLPTPQMQRNAALALLAVHELSEYGVVRRPDDPAAALRSLFLPGRFQLVLSEPDWIFDTAHNREALGAAVDAFMTRECRGRRVILFGGMNDKVLPADFGDRLRAVDAIVTAPIGLPRSRTPDQLRELFATWRLPLSAGTEPVKAAGRQPVRTGVRADLPTALTDLAGGLRREDAVLVTGSCFLVAEVLYRLGFDGLEQTRSTLPAAERMAAIVAGERPPVASAPADSFATDAPGKPDQRGVGM
jgi:dihydrofolate synthase/folylpolyglutamate synthase